MDRFDDMVRETATPDQSFMLMLCERIEKLEEEWTVFKKELSKKNKLAPCAQVLYDKISDIYRLQKEEEQKENEKKIAEMVPAEILVKVPENLVKLLLDVLSSDSDVKKHSYASYFAMNYLEKHHNIDEEFVKWYGKRLGF